MTRQQTPTTQEQLFAALEQHAPKAAKAAKAKAKQQASENKTYTLKEAATLLHISEGVLRLTIRCGKIPATRRGRGLVVKRADLMPFIDPLYDTRRAA